MASIAAYRHKISIICHAARSIYLLGFFAGNDNEYVEDQKGWEERKGVWSDSRVCLFYFSLLGNTTESSIKFVSGSKPTSLQALVMIYSYRRHSWDGVRA